MKKGDKKLDSENDKIWYCEAYFLKFHMFFLFEKGSHKSHTRNALNFSPFKFHTRQKNFQHLFLWIIIPCIIHCSTCSIFHPMLLKWSELNRELWRLLHISERTFLCAVHNNIIARNIIIIIGKYERANMNLTGDAMMRNCLVNSTLFIGLLSRAVAVRNRTIPLFNGNNTKRQWKLYQVIHWAFTMC